MPDRSSNIESAPDPKPRKWQVGNKSTNRGKGKAEHDVNVTAFSVFQQAVGEAPKVEPEEKPKKNPAAVSLGRLGGMKGGAARAQKLTPERRAEIARAAAAKRWSRSREQTE